MRRVLSSLPWILLAACAGHPAGTVAPAGGLPPGLAAIREDELKADLYALAGDHFLGRESGTLDELKASAWLAERARQAGLAPAGDDGTYFQFWPMARTRVSTSSKIQVGSTAFPVTTDAVVLTTGTAIVDAPLVDGGDGAGLDQMDLAGKAVVIQITSPKAVIPDKISLRPARYLFAAAGELTTALAKAKPAAIILVSDAVADSGWEFVSNWYRNGSYDLQFGEAPIRIGGAAPVIWLKQAARPAPEMVRRRVLPGPVGTAAVVGPGGLWRQFNRVAAGLPLAGPEEPDQPLDRASGRFEELGSSLANVRYNWVFRHGSSFHQFFGSTEHRGGEAGLLAGCIDPAPHRGVCQVPDVPGQQKVDAVGGRNRDVERVGRCLGGQEPAANQRPSEILSGWRSGQGWNVR